MALLLALAVILPVFYVYATSGGLTLPGGPPAVEAARGSQPVTSPRISLSDVNNTRGYELGVFGIGFSGGTAAAVYVLHDPSMAPGVFDDGASEAALCQRIIDQGAFFGGAIVGSDSRVVVFGRVTAPTFGPGNHNYICMVDGAGRMSGTDVERFHLEHTIRVVPSVATAGDSVTIFAQDYPNPGAGLTALKVGGRTGGGEQLEQRWRRRVGHGDVRNTQRPGGCGVGGSRVGQRVWNDQDDRGCGPAELCLGNPD